MKKKWEVWLVDDLPSNLKDFRSNHEDHYDIRTFRHPSQVMRKIRKGKCPDALLCDVFFYDTAKEAERVEKEVDKLSENLKRAATKVKANDHSRTSGIDLMEEIYEHFDRQRPPFPMYAYTSKGPFLLERKEWKKLSKFGVEILLKKRVAANNEQHKIDTDIDFRKQNAKRVFIGHGRSPAWKRLRTFLKKLKLDYDEFNRISAAGQTTQQRLADMLNNCGFAFLVFTAEDGHNKTRRARENVIHELGLFQGRLGWKKAIILLEDGCEEFSNILGLTQIRFANGKIEKQQFNKVQSVLKREGLIAK
jgi:predicted nucleotide-binding protein